MEDGVEGLKAVNSEEAMTVEDCIKWMTVADDAGALAAENGVERVKVADAEGAMTGGWCRRTEWRMLQERWLWRIV